MPNAGINPASLRIVTADGHVVYADKRHQDTHPNDQPERAVSSYGKCQADYVRFAGAPIAVKDCSGPRRINIARPFGPGNDHPMVIVGLSLIPTVSLRIAF